LGGGKADAANKCQRERAGAHEITSHGCVLFLRPRRRYSPPSTDVSIFDSITPNSKIFFEQKNRRLRTAKMPENCQFSPPKGMGVWVAKGLPVLEAVIYKDTTPWPGVVVRAYDGETPSLIPGFKTVSMRDVIMQPGSKTMGPPMMNAMICHITEGELRVEQDEKTFTAKKNFVWTCNKETKEQSYNDGNVVAIMRITDLKA
jgi:hypothetical protein